jgi:hypothetical protein
MMRALTVKQPWADLIMAGVKDVENRSWPVPSTLPCAICGRPEGGADPEDGHDFDPFPFLIGIHAAKAADRTDRSRYAWNVCFLANRYANVEPALGVLLGFVTVTGCHHADECMTGRVCHRPCQDPVRDRVPHQHVPRPCSRWAEPDVYHWTLTAPEPLDAPVPMRGAQRLWRLPETVPA